MPDRGQGGRNGLAARDCRGQQGPGGQVEGGKTASAGRAVEAGRNGPLLVQVVQDQNEGGKSGVKSGELGLRVADGRGVQGTEGEGGGG